MKAAQILARLVVDELTPLVREAQLTSNELRKVNNDLDSKISDLKALVKQIPPGTQSIPGGDIKILENVLTTKFEAILNKNIHSPKISSKVPHHILLLAALLIFLIGLLIGLLF